MYFDFRYYRIVLAIAWSKKGWGGRRAALFKLLVLVPAQSLLNTLFMLLDYVFFPRLWRQRVEKPVFIVGHGRSGTTLMHRLMAADGDRFSYFLFWETMFPSIAQRKLVRAIGWLDRVCLGSRIRRRLEIWDENTFGPFRHMHDQGLWIPEEDLFVMRTAFVTQQWTLDIPISDRVDIFHIDDLSNGQRRGWMRFYKECVKRQLYLSGGGKTHLAKNPVMSGWINAILETFPDAGFVVMVRDPAQCIPSNLALVEAVWKGKGWTRSDYGQAQEVIKAISYDCYALPPKAFAAHPGTPHMFVDYRDLIASPKETVEAVYERLGLDVTPAFAAFLSRTQGKEKKHAPGFGYSMDDYGIELEEIVRRLQPFYDRYGWPVSPPAPKAHIEENKT